MATSFPIPPEQRVIRTYTGRAEQPIRTIFLAAAQAAQAEIDIEALEALLSGGRGISDLELRAVAHIDTMIGRLEVDLLPLLDDLLHRSASAGELVFAESLGIEPLDLGIFRRDASHVARTMVGDLIQGIEHGRLNLITGERSQGQLGIVRDLVAEGFDLGRSHAASARLIRDVIGLDERRAKALARYAAELEAMGVPEERRIRLVEKEGRKKLQSRGLAVSRTESVRAANLAQDMIWERAISERQIEDVYEQEWVPSPNACEVCQGLRGARAPIGGTFPDPGGAGPPDPHTHCRCGKRLRRRGE
jgi:hypothetical protein